MLIIAGHNSDPSNLYTVTTRTTGSSGIDLQPNSDFAPFTVNAEALEAVETEMSSFSGVTWFVYDTTGQRRSGFLEVATAISGTVDDYAPTGWVNGPYEVLIVTATGLTPGLSGLAGGEDGRRATIINASGGGLGLRLLHDSGLSDPGNRILHSGALGVLTIPANGAANFVYQSGQVGRWRHCGG
jgi:hypothetical protein